MNSNLRRWAALVVVCLGQLMIMVDSTIVNVALPYMQRDLGFTPSSLTWVVNAYLIAYGSFLLVAGRLGDLIGRRKVFLAGVFLFTVASRAQAMSVFTLVIAGGGSLGLLAGGFLTEWVNWHWIFFINVPIGIATMVLGSWLIEENEGLGLSHGVDIAGAVLITSALMLGVYDIVTAADYGWTSAHTGSRSSVRSSHRIRRQSSPRCPTRIPPARCRSGRTTSGATSSAASSGAAARSSASRCSQPPSAGRSPAQALECRSGFRGSYTRLHMPAAASTASRMHGTRSSSASST